jgi:hypothetical protein
MATNTGSWGAIICAAILLAPAAGTGAPQDPKHDHQQTAAKPAADKSPKCQALMAGHEKVMAQMKAADERLDALAAKMTAATGHSQIDAISAVVLEMVAQRTTMRGQMTKMHGEMMSHMMEHMQAGKESMAMCPMMKMGGMKH